MKTGGRVGVTARIGTILLAVMLLSTGAVVGMAQAGPSCTLEPQLRDVTVGQGLPYSNNAPLVRLKDVLVRFYLSLPSCAASTDALYVRSANLSLGSGDAIPARWSYSTPAPISTYANAPALKATSDPLFLVPASRLTGGSVSFSLSLNYSVGKTTDTATTIANLPVAGPKVFNTFNNAAITRSIHAGSAPLRILAVPIGDSQYFLPATAKNDTAPQLTPNGQTAATAGFASLARLFPVSNSTGSLGPTATGTGGVRYYINSSGLVDVRNHMVDPDDPSTKNALYCDEGFSDVRNQLATFRTSFNTVGNPEPATQAMGLVDQSLADPSTACARGKAAIGGAETWVRALYPAAPQISSTGALMGMEVAHNFGAVPLARDGVGDIHHSPNEQADGPFPNRGYNLLNGDFIDTDKSVMKFFLAGWHQDNTLLEKTDWDFLFCKLGGPVTSDCSTSGQGVAGAGGTAPPEVEDVILLVGSTDFTPGNTDVYETFTTNGFSTAPDDGSRLRLLQLDGNGDVIPGSDVGVQVNEVSSDHHDAQSGGESGAFTFSATLEKLPNAEGWQLIDAADDGEILASRQKNVPPTITGMEAPDPLWGYEDDPLDNEENELSARVLAYDVHAGAASTGSCAGTLLPSRGRAVAHDPSDGNLYTTLLVEENLPVSDGLIHKITPPDASGACTEIATVPFADGLTGPTGTQDDIGALDVDPDDQNLWAAGFALRNGVAMLYSVDGADGGIIESCSLPWGGAGNDTLTVAKLSGLPGSGKYLLTDAGNEGSLFAVDVADCTDGAEVEAVAEWPTGPLNGIDFEDGRLVAFSNGDLLDLGAAPFDEVEEVGSTAATEDLVDISLTTGAQSGSGGSTGVDLQTVTVTVTDPNLGDDLSITWFGKCDDLTTPLFVNQPPDENGEKDENVTFTRTFDTTNLCSDGGEATIFVRVDDGFSTAVDETEIASGSDHAPTPAISAPADGYELLEHQSIKGAGSASDFEDGAITSPLDWEIEGPSGTFTASGDSFLLQPPAPSNEWVPGEYTATLTTVDSDGNEESTSTTFRILPDDDNDGVPGDLNPCAGEDDQNPQDWEKDPDQDGIPNRDEPAGEHCTPTDLYEAGVTINPNTLNVPSTGGTIKGSITIEFRNVADIVQPSVQITKLGGTDTTQLEFPSPHIPAIDWKLKNHNTLEVLFDRQVVEAVLQQNKLVNSHVTITIGGQGSTTTNGTADPWSFEGTDTVRVIHG